MKNKKYELVLDDTIQVETGATLYRIRACKDFGMIKKGELGGYIEKEANLSQGGNAWIFDTACVYENARVSDNAKLSHNAHVYGTACVADNVRVSHNARIYGNARVMDNANVSVEARIYGDAYVYGSAKVYGSARIYGNANVRDNTRIGDEAKVYGSAQVCGNGLFEGCGKIKKDKHYFIANSVGSEDGVLTAFASEKGIEITRGCFVGTIQEFEEAARKTHGDSRVGREYQALLTFIKLKFKKRLKKYSIR